MCAFFKGLNKQITRSGGEKMKRISFTMQPDSDGRITVTSVIQKILETIPGIRVPNTDITRIPLAALSLMEDQSKYCVDGYVDGKEWKDGRFTEYQFTLVFA